MVNLTEEEKLELGIYIERVIQEEIQKIVRQEAKEISKKIETRPGKNPWSKFYYFVLPTISSIPSQKPFLKYFSFQ